MNFEHFISNCTLFASTFLGSLSTRCWICSNSCIRASVRSGTDVGRWGSGFHSVFQIIIKVLSGVLLWPLCRPVKLFHIRLTKYFLYGLCFVLREALSLWNRKGSANCCNNIGSFFSKMSLYTVDLSSLKIYEWPKLLITKCSHNSDLVVLLTRF